MLTYYLRMSDGESPALGVGTVASSGTGRAGWTDLAEDSIGGRPLASLDSVVDEIRVRALYRADDPDGPTARTGLPGGSPHTRGGTASAGLVSGWDLRSLVLDHGPEAANAAVIEELEGGAGSVLLAPVAIGIDGRGCLERVLDGVHLDMAGVALVPGPAWRQVAGWLVEVWEDRGVPGALRRGDLGADPLGVAARHGTQAQVGGSLIELVVRTAGSPGVRGVCVDSTPYSDAGLGAPWELACSLATGTEYLRSVTDGGVALEDALASMAFTYSATADQFLTIAKFRAARRCWDRIAGACGAIGSARAQVQRAVTSAAMLSRQDPRVNVLRATTAGFAAGVAGADSVTLHPFDGAAGVPDAFGRRLARNTQLLLMEESGLARVLDPAGGSWYVEDLTERLAAAAWDLFTSVEADGGMAVALAGGRLAAEADAAWAARLARLESGEEVVTGVTRFQDPDEEPLVRPDLPPAPDGPFPLRRPGDTEALTAADGRAAL